MATTKTTTKKATTSRKSASTGKNEMKIIEQRKSLYDLFVKNLQPDCVDDKGNVLTRIGNAPVDILYVDPKYQGDRNHKKTRILADNFDWNQYDRIKVVLHNEESLAYIVDGQNRFSALKMNNATTIPVKVITINGEDDLLKFEAKLFVDQDKHVDKLKPIEKHNALLILGDKAATVLEEELNEYNVTFKNTQGNRSSRVLGSYPEALSIAKVYGKMGLDFILRIIKAAGWSDEVNGYNSTLFRALKNIYAAHDSFNSRVEIGNYLGVNLRHTTPNLLQANAVTLYPNRDKRMALTLHIEDMLVDAGIVEKTFFTNESNGNITIIKESERKTA